jgi:hypothetical protein
MNNIAAKPASLPETTNGATTTSESNRTIWIYTGYVGAALALLGVLAYHFSSYVLR